MTSTDYIAIASVVIALLALITTIAQLRATKKHNILSVRPLIRFHIENEMTLSYSFENHGLGPGIVKEFTIIIDKQPFTNPTHEQLKDALSVIYGDQISAFEYEYHLPVIGAAYKPGQIVELLKFRPLNRKVGIDTCDFMEGKIALILLYQSMYGEETFGCGTKSYS